MAITMASIFAKVRALLDEYTEDGIQVSAAETIDMQNKAIVFADMAQKELYKAARNEKNFEFGFKPPKNLLGEQFDQVDFEGTDQTYEAEGVKAYYFEADDTGTAYVEEFDGVTWNVLSTIPLTADGTYVAYKGIVSASDISYPVRLRFSGTTYYKHVNRALFGVPFKLERIPIYKEWFPIVLPSDFVDISQIVSQDYEGKVNYKWEKPKQLYFNFKHEIKYRMTYNPMPVTVTAITDTLEVSEIVGQAIVYYIAANIAPYENTTLVNTFWQKWSEMKVVLDQRQPVSWEKIQSVYTIGGEF